MPCTACRDGAAFDVPLIMAFQPKKAQLETQKAGKTRMRRFGKVEVPQEAFIAALKMDED